jgi:hypothetical protein
MKVTQYKNGRKVLRSYEGRYLHGTPGVIEYDDLDQLRRVASYWRGRLHSYHSLPAESVWSREGVLLRQRSFLKGQLHGHQYDYSSHGALVKYEHYRRGKLHSPGDDIPARVLYHENGNLAEQYWCEHGELYRRGHPARLDWNTYGEPVFAAWSKEEQILANRPQWIYYTRDGMQNRLPYKPGGGIYYDAAPTRESATVPPHAASVYTADLPTPVSLQDTCALLDIGASCE